MQERFIACPWRASIRIPSFRRLVAHVACVLTVAVFAPATAHAQAAPPARRDSAQRDSAQRADSAQRIERVLVSAIRAGDAAPIAQTTIRRDVITQRHFGQDVPLLLQGLSPSLSAHTETGTSWGYSYLRLRGLDQTRINITLDGVPLNDMEDQVLYFADLPDLMASVQSVQVQRGVGTSTAGTASFAGSVNFETMPLATRGARSEASLQMGSFGAQRASAAFHSGLTSRRVAMYARVSGLRTNGYRDHSGVMGRSAFLSAGWFGDRTIVKATALAGLLADTLSYTGATLDELRQNRRFNPLHPDERDKFGQQMFALAVSHALSDVATINTTIYRNSASGNYDYFYDQDYRYRYNLAHAWYGVTSAVNAQRGNLHLNLGVNANTYARAHRAYLRPDPLSLYDNTGHKQDASAFAKASLDRGRVRWFADLQARWTRFRYEPDPRGNIDGRSISWTFLNPKLGATVQLAGAWSAFVSFGATTREPTRSDLFAGDDDLNEDNVADYGDFTRVKPESVRDAEMGVSWSRDTHVFKANVYSMDFRNDIARIGAPTASGSILRRNVGASYRRGVEIDARAAVTPRVVIAATAAVSTNRIRSFTDSSRGTPEILRNVEPLLTPRFMTAHRVEYNAARYLTLSVEGRYQSRAFLDNTSSPDRVLPDFYVVDATARATWSRYAFTIRGGNVGETRKFGSGSVSGDGTVRYFVLPARAVMVGLDATF